MEITVNITQVEGLQLVGTAQRKSVVLDTTPKVNGKDAGMTPKPLTVVSILTEMLNRIWKECQKSFKVYTNFQLAEKHPKRFTKIEYNFLVPSTCKDIVKKHLARELSPIMKILKEDIEIAYSFITEPKDEYHIYSMQTDDGYSIHFLRDNIISGDVTGKYGMTHYEIFLLSLGGCTGMDSISILMKMKQDLKRFRMEVIGQVDNNTGTFTQIKTKYIAEGNVDPNKLKKSIELSRDKYCGVQASINNTVDIKYDFEVR